MTDKEIGETVRDIVKSGKRAEVYENKNGIVILEKKCRIIKSDKPRQSQAAKFDMM